MKAALVTGKKTVSIQEIDRPVLDADEVLIKVKVTAVCGSDVHLFNGAHALRRAPAILGHEVAGEIAEVGSAVKSFSIGDRVTAEPHVLCEECEFCKQGLINICLNKKVPGTPNWIGTFVEYFNAPEKSVHKLGDNISYEMGVLIEPLSVVIHSMNRVSIREKDCIVIMGAGTIGILTLVIAKKMGYKTIITTDTAAFNRELSLKFGATAALDPSQEDVAAIVKEKTGGRGADLAMVSAAAPNILDEASNCVRKRGEIGLVSMITQRIPFYSYAPVFMEQNIFGSNAFEAKDFAQSTAMINGGLDLSALITHRFALDQSQEALTVLSEKKEGVGKVLIRMP